MSVARPDDETLMAYADGALDAAARAAVDKAMALDPWVAARVAMFADTARAARTGFGPAEPVPAELLARVEALAAAHPDPAPDNVTVLRRPAAAPASASRWLLPLAAAVALAVAGIAGYVAGTATQTRPGGLRLAVLDEPGLAAALDRAAAGEAVDLAGGTRLRAVATFRDGAGHLCREFEHAGADGSLVAVACRGEGGWRARFAVAAPAAGDGYAPAGAQEALDGYLAAIGAGEPLSPEDERAALGAAR